MALRRDLGEVERFTLAAVRSFATGSLCPAPPADGRWVDVAQQAGVLSVVLDVVGEAGLHLPEAAAHARYYGVATQLRAAVELAAVARAFESTAVRWLVVKGPVLAEVVYRRPGVRTYTDLDVLVHPDDLGSAVAALEDARFRLVDRNWELISRSGRGEINLEIPGGGLLDLHWHLVNDRRIRRVFDLDVRSMFERARTVDLGGLRVPTLDEIDTVVHLALHASLSGGHRLVWFLDLQQAVGHCESAPDDLYRRAEAMGVGLVLEVMLSRAAHYVDETLEVRAAPGAGTIPAWSALCRRVSRSAPPLGVTAGRHTGRLVFSSTRSTTGRSVQAALRLAADEWLPFGEPMTLSTLHSPAGSSEDRERWFVEARSLA